MQQNDDAIGGHVWPPQAQTYLHELRREAFQPKKPERSMLARWAGSLTCLAFLLAFGALAQLYLGRPTAAAASIDQYLESQTVIAPALIPEYTGVWRQAIPAATPHGGQRK